jgi:O-antigen/teichoic acid export membrane protein
MSEQTQSRALKPGGLRKLSISVPGPLRSIVSSPLTRNGYALVMSAGVTSVLGLVFWIFAARLYSPEQVGLGAALISSLLTLGNLAQLNLGNIINRFLPVAGSHTTRFVVWSYIAGFTAAVVLSTIFVFMAESLAPDLDFLGEHFWPGATFVAGCGVWTIFVLQDSVLAGLRQSAWIPAENAIYAVAKILFLLLLAGSTFFGAALFVAWVLPLPAIVAGITVLIFGRLIPLNARGNQPTKPLTVRSMARFLGWDYIGTMAMMLALGGVPLLVLDIAGAEEMANYHLAWTITYSVYLISRSMGISLLAEGAADENRIMALTADTVVHTMIMLIASVVVLFAGASVIMALFGPRYIEDGAELLRILSLACLPWSLITIYLAVARVTGRMSTVAIVQTCTLVLIIVLGAPLLHFMGAFGMAVAWLATHTIVATGIGIYMIRRHGIYYLIDWTLAFATSLGRLLPDRNRKRHVNLAEILSEPENRQLLDRIGEKDATTWQALRVAPTVNDALVIYLGVPTETPGLDSATILQRSARGVFKIASSDLGASSLERHVHEMQRLRSDARFDGLDFEFPEILAFARTADSARLVERMIHGEEGRITVNRLTTRTAALAAAIRTLARVSQRTLTPTTVDETWLADWIDKPTALLVKPIHTLTSHQQRRDSIDYLKRELRAYWSGRDFMMGLGHGDFCPRNIMFKVTPPPHGATAGTPSAVEVAGFIDWDRTRTNAPAGLDFCNLALTTRVLLRAQELGKVVCDLLIDPHWTADEELWLATEGGWNELPREPQAIRALVMLTWLHHVHGNLEKTDRYRYSRLWSSRNVERVLQCFRETGLSGHG